jgi:hypothetical protein
MTTARKNGQLILLISSILIVVPMVVFPRKFGINLATGSFIYSLFEVLYYGLILFLFRPRTTLFKLFQGAGLTFLFRILLGTVLGLFFWALYGTSFTVSLTLSISRYLPAILLHVAVAPFAMRSIYLTMLGDDLRHHRNHIKKYEPATVARHDEPAQMQTSHKEPKPAPAFERKIIESKQEIAPGHENNGFERAVKYLGEHHAVQLAAVVDNEGLTMASYHRGLFSADDWAPLSLLFQSANEKILGRNAGGCTPDRLDIGFGHNKIAIVKSAHFNLLVISNRDEDELLGIRISQAAEMIRKYTSERYGRLLLPVTEEKYVSNT